MALSLAATPETRVDPGERITLDPNAIDLGERLRPIDEAFAAQLGQSMKVDGQIHAVDVRPTNDGGWQLAGAGGHRVTGARLAGIPIEATVVMFDGDVARRREAAENLFRRANDPLERAEAIAELVRLHRAQAGIEEASRREARMPRRLKEEAQGMCDTMSHIYGWGDEIAAELGFSKRTIQRDLLIYRGLQPSVIAHLRKNRHPVLKNATQLRAIAKLPPDEQRQVAVRLLAGAKSANEAIRAVRGSNSVKLTPEEKRRSAILGALTRMSRTELLGFCQSPAFHALLSKEARDLLAPIRRDGAGE